MLKTWSSTDLRNFSSFFVGNADHIRSNTHKKQTPYGKTTTTMGRISNSTHPMHGHEGLRSHVLDIYGYYRHKKEWNGLSAEERAEQVPRHHQNDQLQRQNEYDTPFQTLYSAMVSRMRSRTICVNLASRLPITNIEKAFLDQESVDARVFGQDQYYVCQIRSR
jgi:hypothetical protein